MNIKKILIVGVGGQGIILTSRILGNLALELGYDVKISEVHGMSQRGGSVVTHVKYGDKIYSPLVEVEQADFILAFEITEALRWKHFLQPQGLLIVNNQQINAMQIITSTKKYPENIMEKLLSQCNNVTPIEALTIARELGNIKVVNTVILGLLAQQMDIEKKTWINAITSTVAVKSLDINIKAFNKGYTMNK